MTQQELKDKEVQLQKEYEDKRKQLWKQCAFENNPYEIGDVITDHTNHSIRIESWHLYASFGDPKLIYKGVQLDEKGNPTKRQNYTTMHQSNVVSSKKKEMKDPCPDCGSELMARMSGGVSCPKCHYWFCY